MESAPPTPTASPTTTVPTRRALLLTAASFFAGTALGGAGGFVFSRRPTHGDHTASDDPPPPSGDADLDELRRLATRAPLPELMEHSRAFVEMVRGTYPHDPILWRGLQRICDAVLSGFEVPERRLFARWVAQVIERAEAAPAQDLRAYIAQLRTVR